MTTTTETEAGTRPAAGGGAARVLVTYASRHGATRGIAERVAAGLREGGLAVDVHAVGDLGDIDGYGAVVLGAPVYDGRWPPEADDLVTRQRAALAAVPLWLFSVGSFGDTRRVIGPLMRREPRNIAEVRAALSPRDYRVFAGVIERSMWPLPSRIFYHAFGGRLGDHRDWAAIDAWARAIARELRA